MLLLERLLGRCGIEPDGLRGKSHLRPEKGLLRMTRVGFAHEFQNFEGQAELSVMKVGVELSLSQQRFSRERLGKKEASGG